MTQIALPLETTSSAEDGGYIVSAANQHVHEQLQNWQTWPNRTAILIGPPASGKSAITRQFSKQFGGFVRDDADAVDDDQLFHLWNRAQEESKPLLLASAKPVVDWDVELPDLKSRLAASLLIEIGPPDEAMIEGLLQKYFVTRGLSISEEALAYLGKRMERSYAHVQELAAKMDSLAIEKKRAVTLAIARAALTDLRPEEDR